MTHAGLISSLLRNMAMAIATLAVSLAVACSADAVGSESTPTTVANDAHSETTPLTPESLLAELRARGMEFEYLRYRYTPFAGMNGFVHRVGVTGNFVWAEERLRVYEFTGPGEALVAATRVRPDGNGYMMPKRDHNKWAFGGGYGYGVWGPPRYFVQGKVIAAHYGNSTEVPAVLEELMGTPFAGRNAEVEDEERIPGYADMWQELEVEVEFVAAELLNEAANSLSYRIRYRANLVHSFACSGESLFGKETAGDEIRLTMVQRTVNTDVIEMSEPCDLEWKWSESDQYVHGLTSGQTYRVLINGEQVAEFVAG